MNWMGAALAMASGAQQYSSNPATGPESNRQDVPSYAEAAWSTLARVLGLGLPLCSALWGVPAGDVGPRLEGRGMGDSVAVVCILIVVGGELMGEFLQR